MTFEKLDDNFIDLPSNQHISYIKQKGQPATKDRLPLFPARSRRRMMQASHRLRPVFWLPFLLLSRLPTKRQWQYAISSGSQRRGRTGFSPVSRHRNDRVVLFSPAILPLALIKINRVPVFVARAGKQHITDYM